MINGFRTWSNFESQFEIMPTVEVCILLVDFSGTIMIIQKLSQRPFEYQIGK